MKYGESTFDILYLVFAILTGIVILIKHRNKNDVLRKWLTKLLKWYDLPRVTVHGLRHTFASLLIANGTDARTTAALFRTQFSGSCYECICQPTRRSKGESGRQFERLN